LAQRTCRPLDPSASDLIWKFAAQAGQVMIIELLDAGFCGRFCGRFGARGGGQVNEMCD